MNLTTLGIDLTKTSFSLVGMDKHSKVILRKTLNYTNAGQTVYTIDPTVFVDDDGQAYLTYGGFWRMVTVAC